MVAQQRKNWQIK